MANARWMTRVVRMFMWLGCGAVVLGSSCASDVMNALVAAGLDFVEGSAETVLETVLPLETMLGGCGGLESGCRVRGGCRLGPGSPGGKWKTG